MAIGRHSGVAAYTVGQRKGLGVTGPEPRFVTAIDAGANVITIGPEAERSGWRHDVTVRGDSNLGHTYGIDLSAEDKTALVEFMKSL